MVEPRPVPDPSARDEFQQACTRKLQAIEKDVEDYARTLDSVSYPVSDRISRSLSHRSPDACSSSFTQALFSSAAILLIDCETDSCSTSSSLYLVNVTFFAFLPTPIRILRHLSRRGRYLSVAVHQTVLEIPLYPPTPSFVYHQKTRIPNRVCVAV